MSNRRVIIWLVVTLVLSGVMHLLLSYRGRFENSLVPRTTLFEPAAETATRIRITRAGSEVAVLERRGDWRLVSPYSSAVDQQAVVKLLATLMDSQIDSSIGDRELLNIGRSRADLGLDSPQLVVEASGEGRVEKVAFGDVTPDRRGVYAAVAGVNAVSIVASNVFAAVDLPPEGFRRRSLFTSVPEHVDSLDIKRGTGSFVRFRRSGELWRMKREAEETVAASAEKVKTIFDGLVTATAVGFAWPRGDRGEPATATTALLAAYGLDPENAVTITLKRKDLPDQQVSFGKEAGEGLVYALVQNAEAVVTVDCALRDAALADLSEFTDDRLFPYEMSQVSRLSVSDGETNYLLAKDADGAWLLDAPVAAATDPASVAALLTRIASLRQADTNSTGVAIAVTSNSPPVVVSRETVLSGLRLEDLRSREILKIDPAGVKRLSVTVANGGGATSVIYDRDRRAWNVESSPLAGKVDAGAVDSILALLNPLKAQWIVKMKVSASDLRNYGLETPRLTLAIDQLKEDSVRRNVLIGNEAQGGAFATVGSSDAVFVMPLEVVREFTRPLVTEDAAE